jgi:hypothetical protein
LNQKPHFAVKKLDKLLNNPSPNYPMRLGFLLLFIVFSFNLFAQNEAYKVNFTTEKIKIDGVLDEQIWQKASLIGDFWQYFPTDSLKAKYQTEIKIAYDDKNLYVSAKCYVKGKNFVVPSYRRDYRAGGNDNISFIFDTFNDKTNAFLFGLNPLGVMREALMFNGAIDNAFFSEFWDNKWVGTSKVYDDNYWISEAAIPFSTIRFKEGATHFNFKSYRFDTQGNETSTLMQMPQNQIIMNLGYSIPIEFEKPLRKTGTNISIIPYVAAGNSQDFINLKNPNNGSRFNIGGDAKVAVTSGLNLDLTFNPDFSNVEADRQIINLTRFDINLPEQRQFFLENSDLFSGFGSFITNPFLPPQGNLGGTGNQIVSPFFSRQIGIAQDTVTGLGVPNRILYGARLSGKLNDDWRIGLLNAQTAEDEFKGISGANFTVGSVQRKVFGRSNIAAIFVNKQTINPELSEKLSKFNRVAGLEYNLASKNNRWLGKAFYHHTFSETKKDEAFANGFSLMYNVLKYTIKWQHDWVGNGYDAEVGFVPRKNFFHINPTFGLNFYPRTKIVNRYSVGLAYDQYSMPNVGITDRVAGAFLSMSLQNSARFLFTVNQNYTYLFADFNALRGSISQKLPFLKKNTDYTYYNATLNYTSDQRKKLWLFATPIIGQYYDGSLISLSGALNYRYQPYLALAMNFTYNDIKLPIGKNKVYLIGPRFDWTFSKSVFLTTFLQYNSQSENMNVNARFQWRFAPVSDFFLVYIDNYNTTNWQSRSRSIQAKVTYWLNI